MKNLLELKQVLINTKARINEKPELFDYDSYNNNGVSGCVLFHLAKELDIEINEKTTGQEMFDEVVSMFIVINIPLLIHLRNKVLYFSEDIKGMSKKEQVQLANKKIDEFINKLNYE